MGLALFLFTLQNDMTSITPGTGNTLKSSTAEQALIEAATLLKNYELTPSSNPNNESRINLSYDVGNQVASCTYQILSTETIDSDGHILLTTSEYLTNVIFTQGDEGTFKNSTLAGTFLEIVSFLQSKENNSTFNPNDQNRITSNYDTDNQVATGTISLPIVVTINNDGEPVIEVQEYLL